MTAAFSLPEELLLSIFNHIDSVAQLAQCRLTCARWNSTAAAVMFGKKITIKTEDQAIKLQRHLLQDPSKVSLIRHLHFQLSDYDLPPALEQLMHLVITPNIQKLSGFVASDKFFTALIAIADKTHSSFDQLKDVPEYIGPNEGISSKVHLKFKSAIHTLRLQIVNAAIDSSYIPWYQLLDQYPNLTTFTLESVPIQFKRLDTAIKRCHHLKSLSLKGVEPGEQSIPERMSKEQLISWATSHVEKEKALQTISIDETAFYPEFFEYLQFKYPNVSTVSIEKRLWKPAHDINSWVAEDFNRVLDAFKAVSQKQIKLLLPSRFHVGLVVEFVATRQESIRLTTAFQGRNQCLMTIH
ncbi:hypothetical protein MAM1_0195d07748 [Mucor ambiguus]|uniref:F-box domain-containing protein n=1 Tax=Mucor ambiguus TaxID=91626 RepID=A0A0C9MCB1_9FUNG|nr:hypothetical protein MAM1_0195d07748 [Mucor ambiguus]